MYSHQQLYLPGYKQPPELDLICAWSHSGHVHGGPVQILSQPTPDSVFPGPARGITYVTKTGTDLFQGALGTGEPGDRA